PCLELAVARFRQNIAVAGELFVQGGVGWAGLGLHVDEQMEDRTLAVDPAVVGANTLAQRSEIQLLQRPLRTQTHSGMADPQFALDEKDIGLDATESICQRVEE